MTNADLFQREFGIYATELWAMPEQQFLEWLNAPCERERQTSLSPAQSEIVRCKDCTYFIEDKLYGDSWCYKNGMNRVKTYDFCSKGVRRDA